MVTTSHVIDIEREPAEVFAFLQDPRNYMLWQSNLVDVSATDGMNVGSVISFISMGLGRRFELKAQVTANNGKDEFEAVSSQGPITFVSKFNLQPTEKGTRLHQFSDIRTHGIFNLASNVLQSMGDTKTKSDLEQLKIVLENHMDDLDK